MHRLAYAIVILSLAPAGSACRTHDCMRVNESADALRGVPVPAERTEAIPGLEAAAGEAIYFQSYTIRPDGEFRFERTVQKRLASLGVAVQVVDDAKANEVGAEPFSALYLESVTPGGPAAAAGAQRNDLLLTLDGERILSRDHLQHLIEQREPGSAAALGIRRGGEEQALEVTLGSTTRYLARDDLRRALDVVDDRKRSGLRLASLPADIRAIVLEANAGRPGLLVTDVVPGSPAFWGGLQVGDLVVRAGGLPVEDADDYVASLGVRPDGDTLTYEALRGGIERQCRITLSDNALAEGGFSIPLLFHYSSRPTGSDLEMVLGMLFNYSSCRAVLSDGPLHAEMRTGMGWGLALDLLAFRRGSDGSTRLTILWCIPLWWSASARETS